MSDMKKQKKILIAAGGTGGHIIPALALAQDLKNHLEVFFCAAALDKKSAYFTDREIKVYSIEGGTPFVKKPLKFFKNLWAIVRGILQSYKICKKEKPDLVVGFGSFHSFPPLVCAKWFKIPIILFEPNLVPSKVNRIFSRWAVLSTGVFEEIKEQLNGAFKRVSFPIYQKSKIPIEEARAYFGLDPCRFTLLIFGGSQGAESINQIFFQMASALNTWKVQVIHIVGNQQYAEKLQIKYRKEGIIAAVKVFEKNMFYAWQAADIAICRSGAATISELIHYEIPAILIPYPRASENHQKVNAEYFCNKIQAGILCSEKKASPDVLLKLLSESMMKLEEMKNNLSLFNKKQSSRRLYHVVLKELNLKQPYFFIGIGGIGMSALALILLQKGYTVCGSDVKNSDTTKMLIDKGAVIHFQQKAENIKKDMIVVYSSAIKDKHPELQAAKGLNLLLMHRSELLDQLMREKEPILITGTHGKTSTTALLSHTLQAAGFDPSYVIGGIPLSNKVHGYMGKGEYFVGEADESDGSFIRTPSFGALITNVESDHLDFWKSEEKMREGYIEFISQVRNKNYLLWCGDDAYLSSIHPEGSSYGFSEKCDFWIQNFSQKGFFSTFDLSYKDQFFPAITIPMIGRHNALNAAGVFALAWKLGASEEDIRTGLKDFMGVGRRCERKGRLRDSIEIYDDYAHHPTEISTTLKALKQAYPARNVIAVIQPHRYTRLKNLFEEFAESLLHADKIILTDIYAAGEEEIPGFSIQNLVKKIEQKGQRNITYIKRNELVEYLKGRLQNDDVMITLGAGDITQIGSHLLEDA
ncbi:MAG: hypothetical protein Tsb0015_00440 [Simkaniaceae bacterium]